MHREIWKIENLGAPNIRETANLPRLFFPRGAIQLFNVPRGTFFREGPCPAYDGAAAAVPGHLGFNTDRIAPSNSKLSAGFWKKAVAPARIILSLLY